VDVAHAGSVRHRRLRVLAPKLAEHSVEVQRQCVHLERPVANRPLLPRAIAVQLDAVALRVAQVEGLAHEVIGCAGESPAGLGDALQSARQVGAGGDQDRQMEEATGAVGAWRGIRLADQLDQSLCRVLGP
jgi:hypothetical protein